MKTEVGVKTGGKKIKHYLSISSDFSQNLNNNKSECECEDQLNMVGMYLNLINNTKVKCYW